MKVSIEAPESFQTLPTGTQAQLLKQTEYFLKQQVKASDKNEDPDKFVGKVGSAKGKIKMSDDFDEPLEDFKEYME